MRIVAKNQTNANKILKLVNGLELFTDPSGVAWIGLPNGSYPEYVPLKSNKFGGWVARKFYETHGKPVGQKALDDARAVLYGYAADTVRQVYVRVANLEDRVIVDLGHSYAEINAQGWQMTDSPPVPFRRPAGMLPLPIPDPQYTGRLEDTLEEIIGLSNDELILIIGWIIGAYGSNDFPILILNGEQGSGKSTLAEILKGLIDPSEVPLRSVPRDEQGLAVAAVNSWIIALDNLSGVPDWLSDGLCRISTGAGYSARRLYFDLDETFAKTQRPVILNGIPELASRGDLQDRAIVITLPTISDLQRRSKADIMSDFRNNLPVLLGQVFDAVSAAIRLKGFTTIKGGLPRMADFAQWAARGCEVATYSGGTGFLKAYAVNRQTATLALLDLSPIAQELQKFVSKHKNWMGTISDLRDNLILTAGPSTPTEKAIQNMSLKAFSAELRRLAPVLRCVGIEVSFKGLKRVNGIVGRFVELADLNVTQKVKVP